jgi:voltage-gated potassium channel Kch
MDTDDLSEDPYAIIIEPRRVTGLLGAELALAGKNVRSEEAFLRNILAALIEATENVECYVEGNDAEVVSERALPQIVAHCENAVHTLVGRRGGIKNARRPNSP